MYNNIKGRARSIIIQPHFYGLSDSSHTNRASIVHWKLTCPIMSCRLIPNTHEFSLTVSAETPWS